jgi:molybdopterin-guanine dinucleotide biosynthesis protein A
MRFAMRGKQDAVAKSVCYNSLMFPLSAIILAGGQSRRMGTPKAMLMLAGHPLLEWVVLRLRPLAADLIIVTNAPVSCDLSDAQVVGDLVRGAGALGGLHAGLMAAKHEWALAVACDMPFLNRELLNYLASLAIDQDAVVPRLNGVAEPLHALYHRRCLPVIERNLTQGCYKMASCLAEMEVHWVEEEEIDRYDPQHRSFFNVNTLEDWEQARRLAGEC